MPGTISLIHYGDPVSTHKYKDASHKKLIISNWQKLYGPAFNNATVKDDPAPPKTKAIETVTHKPGYNPVKKIKLDRTGSKMYKE